jgi:hypothetical protein
VCLIRDVERGRQTEKEGWSGATPVSNDNTPNMDISICLVGWDLLPLPVTKAGNFLMGGTESREVGKFIDWFSKDEALISASKYGRSNEGEMVV